jgi:hypothetical protein
MAKLLPLDESWRAQVRDLTFASPIFGRLLAPAITSPVGTMQVLVPDSFNSLSNQDLRHDLLNHDDDFGDWQEVCAIFDQHLAKSPRCLIVTYTYWDEANAENRQNKNLPYFWCSSQAEGLEDHMCLYLTPSHANLELYDDFVSEARTCRTLFLLTSLTREATLIPGEHLTSHSAKVGQLIARASRALLAVFDERSFLVWNRNVESV